MQRAPFPNDFPEDWKRFFLDSVFDEASGVPIILDSAPTTNGGELKEGERGFYNNEMYETINGITYKHSLTQV